MLLMLLLQLTTTTMMMMMMMMMMMGTLKTRDWKTWDQMAGVEKTGLVNAGPNFQSGKRMTTVY